MPNTLTNTEHKSKVKKQQEKELEERGKENQITPADIISNFITLKVKPNEIDDKTLFDFADWNLRCYSSTKNKLMQYGNEKCVIACVVSSLGGAFVIKSARGYFAFTVMNKILGRPYDYAVVERELIEVVKFMDGSPEIKVLNESEYIKLKKTILVNSITSR